ncbi:MAG: endopeptidase La [Clostridia bacterium]|nr:endopeptidase La [Clostridia bacterium]
MRVIPLYNFLLLPDAVAFFSAQEVSSIVPGTLMPGERVVLVAATKEDGEVEELQDRFFPIGVTGVVAESHVQGIVLVNTVSRVHLDSITRSAEEGYQVRTTVLEDTDFVPPEEAVERADELRVVLQGFLSKTNVQDEWKRFILAQDTIEKFAAAMSPAFSMSAQQRYEMLEISSQMERHERARRAVYEFMEITEVNTQAYRDQVIRNQKTYRESAIKGQLEYLQDQLEQMHPENMSDIRRMEQRVAESGMNETARKEATKVLNRLRQEGNHSSEYGMLYDYLDFLTGLSWKAEEMQEIDLSEAEKILDEDHFGLKKIKDRIIQQIAVMNLNHRQYGTILLFVGAPGTGKTSIGQSIARALNRKYVRVSLGGVRDEADIRGHRRTYIGAMPGRIMDGISKSGSANPVMVLDEVDKLSQSLQGDPASALLEVLDPEQNFSFTDHYMNVPYDLSKVMFICTANTADSIPEPLLNRMEVIRFPGYTFTDKVQIARQHLLPRAMESMGIRTEDLQVDDAALEKIISEYTMETGVRGLKKQMDTLCRMAAVRLVRGNREPLHVQEENVREYMDGKPVRHGRILPDVRSGIVTGLAWTAAGGDILFIETTLVPGSGKVQITGQLGDVMKESVSIATSLVQSLFPEEAKQLKDHDLHVHVPDGAVKKDGPSAGITLTTAISSLLTGKTVAPTFGMTGEVSLRGRVMPIGGLPEKLMAAQRAGVTTVLIPEDNRDDLEDVPEEIREKLTIRPVTYVEEVLRIVGILPEEKKTRAPRTAKKAAESAAAKESTKTQKPVTGATAGQKKTVRKKSSAEKPE